MKILSNKRYEQSLKLLSDANNENIDLRKDKANLIIERNELVKKITLLNIKIREINGKNGGYTKEINKLRNEIFELGEKNKEITQVFEEKIKKYEATIADLKSDRYLVKKIPSGRPPKSQTMKLKHEKGSEVARKFLSDYE